MAILYDRAVHIHVDWILDVSIYMAIKLSYIYNIFVFSTFEQIISTV